MYRIRFDTWTNKLSLDLGFDAFNAGCDIFASICREKYF